MSLSSCVCLSEVILFSFEYSKHLKEDVLRELQECLRGVCLKFQGSFKEVLRVLTESYKEVFRVFQGNFKSVSKKSQGNFKGV